MNFSRITPCLSTMNVSGTPVSPYVGQTFLSRSTRIGMVMPAFAAKESARAGSSFSSTASIFKGIFRHHREKPLHRGHLLAAGRTPGCPEIDEYHLASQLGERPGSAFCVHEGRSPEPTSRLPPPLELVPQEAANRGAQHTRIVSVNLFIMTWSLHNPTPAGLGGYFG